MQIPSNSPTFKHYNLNGEHSLSLQQSEERYKTLVTNIPGAVYRCVCDMGNGDIPLQWTVAFLSDAIVNIVGYPPSDFVNNRVRSWASIIHPQDQTQVTATIWKSIVAQQPYALEYRVVHSDGAIRWVYDKGQPVWEDREQGTIEDWISLARSTPSQLEVCPLYLDGVLIDITDRKLAEEKLRQTQDYLNRVLKQLPLPPEMLQGGVEKISPSIANSIPEMTVHLQTESSGSHLARVAQKTPNASIVTDCRGSIEWVNDRFTHMTGYALVEVIGKPLEEILLDPKTDPRMADSLRKAIATQQPFEGEFYQFHKEGQGYWVWLAIAPLESELGEFQGFIAAETDITPQKQTEEILREQASYYRCIVETASEGVWMFDADSKTTFVNNRMAEMLGYPVEELVGRSFFEFMDAESEAIARTNVERRRQGMRERHDFKFQRRDGSHLWAIVSATPIFDGHGQFAGVLRMITDISDRKQAEAELRRTLQELEYEKFALDQSSIVAITDRHGVITYVNDQFCEISQYTREELIGQTHRIVNSGYHPPEFFQDLWSSITQGQVWHGEIKNKAKDNSFYWVDTTIVPFLQPNGKPYQYVAIRKNITDRKEAEEALRLSESKLRLKNQELARALRDLQQTQSMMVQNEKMVSLGQLVAGVAHEINNPVSFIYGNVMHADDYFQDLLQLVQLYQREYPNPTATIREEMEEIELNFLLNDLPKLLNSMKMGAERIRQIVLSLKNFSRLDEAEQKQVDIHEGIESTLLILQHRFKETAGHPKIGLIKEYGILPHVQCYAGQLNQVFMNIIGNAIDALEDAMEAGLWGVGDLSPLAYCPSPTIRIRTMVKEKEKGFDELEMKESPTSHIVIQIADNGPGIPPEIKQRLFDPFFTTKNPGKGTGLGLSISYQIVVDKHGGQLKCISEPGQGAEFVIEIPIRNS